MSKRIVLTQLFFLFINISIICNEMTICHEYEHNCYRLLVEIIGNIVHTKNRRYEKYDKYEFEKTEVAS